METDVIGYYHQGALTGEDLQSAIDQELNELLAEDEALAVRFEVAQPGVFIAEGIIIAIAIGAGSNLAADVAKAIWTKVLKRVKAAHGEDAIGPEADPEAESLR